MKRLGSYFRKIGKLQNKTIVNEKIEIKTAKQKIAKEQL